MIQMFELLSFFPFLFVFYSFFFYFTCFLLYLLSFCLLFHFSFFPYYLLPISVSVCLPVHPYTTYLFVLQCFLCTSILSDFLSACDWLALSIFYLSSLHTNSCTRMCQWIEDSLPPPLPPRFTPPTSCTSPPFSSL